MPPILYFKNALKAALDGLGDGTVYASGPVAFPNQSNRTFLLSGIAIIADIGANSDDKFNSYHLYFSASGNKYLIIDWISGTDIATVWKTPALTDTGPYEVRRALVDPNALALNPVHSLADGRRDQDWKSAINNTTITVALPNLISDGGLESGGLSSWLQKTGTTAANNSNAILGAWDLSISAASSIWATIRGPIKAAKYRILFKAKSASFAPGDMSIDLLAQGTEIKLNYTINSVSSGTFSSLWNPTFTASPVWHWADITINAAQDSFAYLIFNLTGSATGTFIDEVYFFEPITVDSMLVFGELNDSGNSAKINAYNAPIDRSGMVLNTDYFEILPTVNQSHGEIISFSKNTSPIYQITIFTPGASQIMLCEKWAWGKGPNRPFGLQGDKKTQTINSTKSGVIQKTIHHRKKHFKNTLPMLSEVDRLKLIDDFKPNHFDKNDPFAIVIQAGDTPLLMSDNTEDFDPIYQSIKPNWNFDFEEII